VFSDSKASITARLPVVFVDFGLLASGVGCSTVFTFVSMII
jgi:hypothetical protein